MADRDWDKELAKVDKQLASISDDALAGPPPAAPAKGKAPRQAANAPVGEPKGTSAIGVYARLLLAIALGVAITVWPYDARCGVGLLGYLGVVGAVIAGGLWSSIWTFKHRAAKSHTLSLLIVLWGLVLGTMDVLPRIGYGRPDSRHLNTWSCPANLPPLPKPEPAPSPEQPPAGQSPTAQPPAGQQPTTPPQGSPATKPDA
jgi:hypothetical protein